MLDRAGWLMPFTDMINEVIFHSSFQATDFIHPATYLNKILLAGKSGELQLWNTRTW